MTGAAVPKKVQKNETPGYVTVSGRFAGVMKWILWMMFGAFIVCCVPYEINVEISCCIV